jgi:hypothetical protein
VQPYVEEDGAEVVPTTLSTVPCSAQRTAVWKLAPAQPERKILKAQGVNYGSARPFEEEETPRLTGGGQLNGNAAAALFTEYGEKWICWGLAGSPRIRCTQ